MKTEVFLTSHSLTGEDVRESVVVVVDVLRASSTIATALGNGARALIPVQDMAEAGKIASNLDQASYLLGGERGGIKIEGYHYGNSPFEYSEKNVKGRTVIFNTTNGTGAITRSRGAHHIVIGSFLNVSAVVDFLRREGRDIVIVCAGWRNRVSQEDTLCAGMILHLLWEGQEPDRVSDTSHIAHILYLHDRDRLQESIRKSNHAQRLISLGQEQDIDYCSQVDALPVLPYFDDYRLTLRKPGHGTPGTN